MASKIKMKQVSKEEMLERSKSEDPEEIKRLHNDLKDTAISSVIDEISVKEREKISYNVSYGVGYGGANAMHVDVWKYHFKVAFDGPTLEDVIRNILYFNKLIEDGKDVHPADEEHDPKTSYYIKMRFAGENYEHILTQGGADAIKTKSIARIALLRFLGYTHEKIQRSIRNLEKKYNINLTIEGDTLVDNSKTKEDAINYLEAAIDRALDYIEEIRERKTTIDVIGSVNEYEKELRSYNRKKLEEIWKEGEKIGVCPLDSNLANFLVEIKEAKEPSNFLKDLKNLWSRRIAKQETGKINVSCRVNIIDQRGDDPRLIYGPLSFLRGSLSYYAKDRNIAIKYMTTRLEKLYTNDEIAHLGELYARISVIRNSIKKTKKAAGVPEVSKIEEPTEEDLLEQMAPTLQKRLKDTSLYSKPVVDFCSIFYLNKEEYEKIKEGLKFSTLARNKDLESIDLKYNNPKKLEKALSDIGDKIRELVKQDSFGRVGIIRLYRDGSHLLYYSFIHDNGRYRNKIKLNLEAITEYNDRLQLKLTHPFGKEKERYEKNNPSKTSIG